MQHWSAFPFAFQPGAFSYSICLRNIARFKLGHHSVYNADFHVGKVHKGLQASIPYGPCSSATWEHGSGGQRRAQIIVQELVTRTSYATAMQAQGRTALHPGKEPSSSGCGRFRMRVPGTIDTSPRYRLRAKSTGSTPSR